MRGPKGWCSYRGNCLVGSDGWLAVPHSLLSMPNARGKCRKLCGNRGIVFLGKEAFLSVAVVGTCMSSHSTLCIL